MRLRLGLSTSEGVPESAPGAPSELVKSWTAWLGRSRAVYPTASRALAEVHVAFYSERGDDVETRLTRSAEELSRASGARVSEATAPSAYGTGGCQKEEAIMRQAEAIRVARVRRAVPLFVAWTSTLRELSALVEAATESERKHGSIALEVALRSLEHPYDLDGSATADVLGDWAGRASRRLLLADWLATARAEDATDAPAPEVAGLVGVRRWVREGLADRPRETQLKTSCGAQ
ncbi:hypothetical protein T492DRAFT_1018926 [Pavlovales sp. CCMP2436]|nr:hypothetical protein T492DRAFT_1018926 [Pavlovales sp. CCMP2436]